MIRGYRLASELCRIRVRFAHSPLELCYRDERGLAARFAAAAHTYGAAVIIDDDLGDGLGPLPCRRLWA